MPLKFAANISTMFKEYDSLVDRYEAAKNMGFNAVESQFLYNYPLEDISAARSKAGITQVLINSAPGNIEAGDFGFASKPHYEAEFISSMDLSMTYAKALGCKMIHIMAGNQSRYIKDSNVEEVYIENLVKVLDLYSQEGITFVIEPITQLLKPNYFLTSFDQAVSYIKKINSPFLKLQLDIFHLQMICGNLTNNIRELLQYVGHIQVSQAPNRDEPSAPGEINYQYVFSLLDELRYDGWIGLEYTPKESTREGLKWIEEYGYKL
ncbi:putative hydroxypyruvate isomerase [Limulus polyphemus]|uniref:Putative hydroxypyruvate isomerase n=1 Tax=Limulus polyphemus TaxID=6850 RepID=A0ABM1BVG9_LIMPO|nr:putative hydroxypyruvate isomerase [Limulus polyphemus]